jgi:CRISPR-associated protein Csb2
VPDIRGVRTGEWTFAHSALLSLGFAFKGRFPSVAGRGDGYYLRLAQAVTETGAAVVATQVLRTTDVGAYAHRVNDHAVVRPYHALLWLGDLAGSQTVAAIGQARHLGGGMLIPHDITPDDELPDDLEAMS